MELLYEDDRDSLVSIALFDLRGGLVSAVPLSTLKQPADLTQTGWFLSALQKKENLHFSTPLSRISSRTRTTTTSGWFPLAAMSS